MWQTMNERGRPLGALVTLLALSLWLCSCETVIEARGGFACTSNDQCLETHICVGGACLDPASLDGWTGVAVDTQASSDLGPDVTLSPEVVPSADVAAGQDANVDGAVGPNHDATTGKDAADALEQAETVQACPAGACDDGNPCTDDTCDPQAGCGHTANNAKCDDGNACTKGEACADKACQGSTAVTCDDAKVCTFDLCDPASGCVHANLDGMACDDGDGCTSDDHCKAAACLPGAATDCDDANPCTVDACDPKAGCGHVPNTAACDDGDPCTGGDACDAGACVGGAAVKCGCKSTADCVALEDGDLCNGTLICDLQATPPACKLKAGSQIDCSAQGGACTTGTCDPKTGACATEPGTDGKPCDDGSVCTLMDACAGGKCKGTLAGCDDGNACTADYCEPAGAATVTEACKHLALDGKLCSDGDLCTASEQCQSGACKGGTAVTCNDGDPCTVDACAPKTGACTHKPVAGCVKDPCQKDGDCKAGQHCDSGHLTCVACLSHTDCGANSVCVGGGCVPGLACQSAVQCKNTGGVCASGLGICAACNTHAECAPNSACLDHACVPKVPCTIDKDCPAVCGKGLGFCVACNTAADCLDGGICGADRKCHPPACTAGKCHDGSHYACKADGSGYSVKKCDDGNPCTQDACDAAKGCSASASVKGSACSGGLCDGGGVCKGVAKVATSYITSCAIDLQGALWCWGFNGMGQLGDGTTLDRSAPVSVQGLGTKVVDVALSNGHTCAVDDSGKVWCWGENHSGQLGDGKTSDAANPQPKQVGGLPLCNAVSLASNTSCALGKDGSVWCWGYTPVGETGVGTMGSATKQPEPKKLVSLGLATAIAGGGSHFCALLQTGAVSCWGQNTDGRLGNGKDGCVTGDGCNSLPTPYPVTVLDINDATAIAATGSTTCARRKTGEIWCWGSNGSGTLGNGKSFTELKRSSSPMKTSMTGATSITGTSSAFCAGRSDGSVSCWGQNSQGNLGSPVAASGVAAPTPIPGLDASGGLSGLCAIAGDGTLRCWGPNYYGRVGDGTRGYGSTSQGSAKPSLEEPVALSGITALRGGHGHACAVAAGKTWCWGNGSQGVLGHGGTTSAAAPVSVKGLAAATVSLAPSYDTTCVVQTGGSVWCWGSNHDEKLGTVKDYKTLELNLEAAQATKVVGTAQSVAGSQGHFCAVLAGGLLQCWGSNNKGESSAANLSGVLQVGAGSGFTCARLAGGKIDCWGGNAHGQLGLATTSTQESPGAPVKISQTATDLAVGDFHACALVELDKVGCWGANHSGQAGREVFENVNGQNPNVVVPYPHIVTGLPAAKAVFAGYQHTCAITAAGEPWCWGRNSSGQLGDGTTSSGEAWKVGGWKPRKVKGWTGKATAMALGQNYSCALREDGKAFCWGETSYGIIGDGSAWKDKPVLVKGLP